MMLSCNVEDKQAKNTSKVKYEMTDLLATRKLRTVSGLSTTNRAKINSKDYIRTGCETPEHTPSLGATLTWMTVSCLDTLSLFRAAIKI
jgi:hypothetical protein